MIRKKKNFYQDLVLRIIVFIQNLAIDKKNDINNIIFKYRKFLEKNEKFLIVLTWYKELIGKNIDLSYKILLLIKIV